MNAMGWGLMYSRPPALSKLKSPFRLALQPLIPPIARITAIMTTDARHDWASVKI